MNTMKNHVNCFVIAPLNQVTYFGLQRRLLQFTSDGSNEIPNPLICLEESDVLIFRIFLDTNDRLTLTLADMSHDTSHDTRTSVLQISEQLPSVPA